MESRAQVTTFSVPEAAVVRQVLEEALAEPRHPAFLVDAQSRASPLHAQALPHGDGPFHIGPDGVRHTQERHQQRWREALDAALAGHRAALTVPAGAQRFARLQLQPLPRTARRDDTALVLVRLEWRGMLPPVLPSMPELAAGLNITPGQARVLRLLCEGLTTKQIAQRLDCGVTTVRTHIAQMLSRLDLHRQGELVQRALQLC